MDQITLPEATHYLIKKGDQLRSMHPQKRLTQAGRSYPVLIYRLTPAQFMTAERALSDSLVRLRLGETHVKYLESLAKLDPEGFHTQRTVQSRPAEVRWVGTSGYYFDTWVEPGRLILNDRLVQ